MSSREQNMANSSLMNYGSSRRLMLAVVITFIIIDVAFVLGATTQKGGTSTHFVLIHGASHGAWCWYKIITLLQRQGNVVTALDLTSNGINKAVADQVTSIAQYVKPLTDFLRSNITRVDEKVILVGHSLAGGAISYAMEHFSDKVEKAVFLSAFMPKNGESYLPMQDLQADQALIQNMVFLFNYANGSSSTPTSVYINLAKAREYFYNRSPIKDVNLALTLLNPSPYRPVLENLTLTQTGYGSIKRYYIKTTMDHVLPPSLQEQIVQRNPPNRVFIINGSDHSAFLSYPKSLSTILNTIAKNQTS